jgi:flagellin
MALGMITNVSALGTQRVLAQTQETLGRSLARLASGRRITSAADDAAGLAVADQLDQAAAVDGQARRNVADALGAVQVVDQTLGRIGDITGRLSTLASEAANGLLTDDQRGAIQQEAGALTSEIDRIAGQAGSNGASLLQPGTSVTVQAGGTSGDQIALPGADASTAGLGLAGLDLSTQGGAQAALDATSGAAAAIAQQRGAFGAAAAELGTADGLLAVAREQALAARARIADTDVAQESVTTAVSSTLVQMQVRALVQANHQAGALLSVFA